METIFIVYKTDNWHSYASRDVIGIATNKYEAVNICLLQAAKENVTTTLDQKHNLVNISQTQGYEGDGEFQFEEMNTNTLL